MTTTWRVTLTMEKRKCREAVLGLSVDGCEDQAQEDNGGMAGRGQPRVLLKAIILGAWRDDLQVGAQRATVSGCVSSRERNAGARNLAKGGKCTW